MVAGVGARDEEAAQGIHGAVTEGSFAHLVVARIFFEQARKDGGGHVRADAVVGEGSAVTFSVGAPALSPGLRIIFGLADPGEQAVEWIGGPIKYASGGQPEFLPRSQGWRRVAALDGAVVRQDFEDAIVDGASFLFELAFANCVVGFV